MANTFSFTPKIKWKYLVFLMDNITNLLYNYFKEGVENINEKENSYYI